MPVMDKAEDAAPKFHAEVVCPNVGDYRENLLSTRHAFNAIASLDSLAAHLFHWWREEAQPEILAMPDDSCYRNHLTKKYEGFALLRDIAKAQKHAHLTRGKKNPPVVKSASSVTARHLEPDTYMTTESISENGVNFIIRGFNSGHDEYLAVTIGDGRVFLIEDIINAALDCLEREIIAICVWRVNKPTPGETAD